MNSRAIERPESTIRQQTPEYLGPWHPREPLKMGSLRTFLISTVSRKSAWKKKWVRESETGEECRQFWALILGVKFLGAWYPGKTRPTNLRKNSPSNFAEKFVGNLPKICWAPKKKFTPNPLCRTSGSTFYWPWSGEHSEFLLCW